MTRNLIPCLLRSLLPSCHEPLCLAHGHPRHPDSLSQTSASPLLSRLVSRSQGVKVDTCTDAEREHESRHVLLSLAVAHVLHALLLIYDFSRLSSTTIARQRGFVAECMRDMTETGREDAEADHVEVCEG